MRKLRIECFFEGVTIPMTRGIKKNSISLAFENNSRKSKSRNNNFYFIIQEYNMSQTIPTKYHHLLDENCNSILVNYRKVLKYLCCQKNAHFVSFAYPQNKLIQIINEKKKYCDLSNTQQYNYLTGRLKRIHWGYEIPVYDPEIIELDYSDMEHENVIDEACIFFEITKNGNVHFHMIVTIDGNEHVAELKHKLIEAFELFKKTDQHDIIYNIKKIDDAQGIYDYCLKEGEHTKKNYECLRMDIFRPLLW